MTDKAQENLPNNTEINPKEHAKAITTKSGVQLPEIHVKALVVSKESMPDDEIVEHSEQTTEDVAKKSSNTSCITATNSMNPYKLPIPFPQRLKKHNWINNRVNFLKS